MQRVYNSSKNPPLYIGVAITVFNREGIFPHCNDAFHSICNGRLN